MMVVRMHLQMLGQFVYPPGKQRHLDLGRASITLMNSEIRNGSSLLLFVQIHTPHNPFISQDYNTGSKSLHKLFSNQPTWSIIEAA